MEWVNDAGTTILLHPESGVRTVGEDHTVTAVVTDGLGAPIDGIDVNFLVSGAHNETGSGTAGEEGEVAFTYTGTNTGEDEIEAWFDDDGVRALAHVVWDAVDDD